MPQDDEGYLPPPEPAEGPDDTDKDYVFRFRLEPAEPDEAGYDDPLLELIRGQLADLLDAVVLTHHGKRVRVDGFRLLQDPDTQYDIFPKSGSASGHEPAGG